MTFVPDAILLDRIYQPICNRLARWTDGPHIGQFFLDGAIVAIIFAMLWASDDMRLVFGLLSGATALVTITLRLVFSRIARLLQPGGGNVWRYKFRVVRLLLLINLLFMVTTADLAWSDLATAFLYLAFSFASCEIYSGHNG
jgi:hypothetical protein